MFFLFLVQGLGTSTPQEAKAIFKSMDIVRYTHDEDTKASMDLAFGGNADARKDWITKATECPPDEVTGTHVKVTDFVNRELVQFSIADVKRSIPSAIDGLKPSQRKVIYACFKRNLKEDVKVAQLTGYASEVSHYVHGEASLSATIVNLAQNYCGSNNVNLLEPVGQFGSRLQGGKDSASARYISTRLREVARVLFPECDAELLDYVDDDGDKIEPVYYVPIVPVLLLNGSEGIGTGFSTYVPSYNPREVSAACRAKLDSANVEPLTPWFRGFKGGIDMAEDDKSFVTKGTFKRIGDLRIEVSELPVGTWTDTFKDSLEDDKAQVESFQNRSTETDVKFLIRFKESARKIVEDDEALVKHLRLASKRNMTNMHLFDSKGVIQRFEDPRQILDEFFEVRLDLYGKRKLMMQRKVAEELLEVRARRNFVSGVVDGSIKIMKATDNEVKEGMEKAGVQDKYRKNLMEMSVKSLTAAKIKALDNELEALERKQKEIEAKDPEKMWKDDLDKFDALL